MTIPDYESLMPIVLELAGREQPIREPVETISDRLELSVEERAQLIPSGGKTLIKSRIEWAVTYLVHAGLLKRPRRGHFVITERGQEIIANPPPKIDQQFLRQYPEFISFITRRRSDGIEPITTASAAESPDEGRTPEERIGGAYEILEGELKTDFLNRIIEQSPTFFETLVVKLLSAMGYGSDDTLAQAIGKSGDGGIDGVTTSHV
jgi:restriction system protein